MNEYTTSRQPCSSKADLIVYNLPSEFWRVIKVLKLFRFVFRFPVSHFFSAFQWDRHLCKASSVSCLLMGTETHLRIVCNLARGTWTFPSKDYIEASVSGIITVVSLPLLFAVIVGDDRFWAGGSLPESKSQPENIFLLPGKHLLGKQSFQVVLLQDQWASLLV